jgi:amino acid transporter
MIATFLTVIIILGLSFFFPIENLARSTTFMALSVFLLVNLALCRIKLRDRNEPPHFSVPLWVPVAGVILSGAILGFETYKLAA